MQTGGALTSTTTATTLTVQLLDLLVRGLIGVERAPSDDGVGELVASQFALTLLGESTLPVCDDARDSCFNVTQIVPTTKPLTTDVVAVTHSNKSLLGEIVQTCGLPRMMRYYRQRW